MKITNKINLLLLFLMVMTSCLEEENLIVKMETPKESSSIVAIEDARIELEKLLDDIYGTQSTRMSGSGRKIIANAFTIKDAVNSTRSADIDSLSIHIFNFENKDGFAIMSGNSELPSLLALAESGEIIETAPVDNIGFAIFMENMEKEYVDGLSSSVSTSPSSYKKYGEWENIVYKQDGYCNVKWSQEEPYNMYCPLKGDIRTVTGCVPTAVAQLMSIYKYPSSYNGYSFDWDKMTVSAYGIGCTFEGQTQIARLMSELGAKSNLNVSYNTAESGGSGASADNIPRTLKNFGYSNGGSLSDYKTETVVSELKNGYSVLVGGYCHKTVSKFLGFKINTKYSGGHKWLCHGLLERRRTVKTYNSNGVLQNTTSESEWYPLCNWGWGGYQDGYYLSNAFDSKSGPSYPTSTRNNNTENGSEDYNFQYKITTVTGIRK